jgi:hypothetical protein
MSAVGGAGGATAPGHADGEAQGVAAWTRHVNEARFKHFLRLCAPDQLRLLKALPPTLLVALVGAKPYSGEHLSFLHEESLEQVKGFIELLEAGWLIGDDDLVVAYVGPSATSSSRSVSDFTHGWLEVYSRSAVLAQLEAGRQELERRGARTAYEHLRQRLQSSGLRQTSGLLDGLEGGALLHGLIFGYPVGSVAYDADHPHANPPDLLVAQSRHGIANIWSAPDRRDDNAEAQARIDFWDQQFERAQQLIDEAVRDKALGHAPGGAEVGPMGGGLNPDQLGAWVKQVNAGQASVSELAQYIRLTGLTAQISLIREG